MIPSIAIIGNGKLTKSLVAGFINSGMNLHEILVLGREQSDLTFFEQKGIPVSRNILDAKKVPTIILSVTPAGIGTQLRRLKKLKIQKPKRSNESPYRFFVEQKIISISSGTNIEVFAKILDVHPGSIVKATMNTNVEFLKGIIRLSGIHDGMRGPKDYVINETEKLFSELGKVEIVSSQELTRSIATVGAMNALDVKALSIIIKNKYSKLVYESNEGLRTILQTFRMHLGQKLMDGNLLHYAMLHKYIHNKALVLEKTGYTKENALKLSFQTIGSTLDSLLAKDDLCLQSFEKMIHGVATKGGCTEKGINLMQTINDLFDEKKFWNVLRPIYRKTKKFKKEAQKSITK